MPDSLKSQRFKDTWSGEERRGVTPNGLEPERAADIELLITRHVEANRKHFDEKMDALEVSLSKLFASAFPNGDPIGHRAAHEAQIKSADWWSRMKTETFLNLAKSGAWVAVVWVAYAAWEHFKEAVRK